MSLPAGTAVGPYEILAPIGAGGMGEVYRARDTKLDRDVALKILPEAIAADRDRLARFDREAKTLASLNHPNIAAVYGFEDRAIVMELVEGEDLSAQMARGPVPLADALSIARQIALALDAAHEAGIIHRDLKPANIKVRSDGTVKVLDFGLAKALEPAGAPSTERETQLPTMTSPAMTQVGMILGTAAYMSPEQARGRPVDRRADIWAFGVVLYEMLTGRRAFAGDDVSEVLASVLKDTPSFDALPAETPHAIRRLLRRALERDRTRRLGSMHDARLELDEAASDLAEGGSAGVESSRASRLAQSRVGWAIAAVCAVGLVAFAAWVWLRPAASVPVLRLAIPTSVSGTISRVVHANGVMAISPDGSTFVFLAGQSAGDSLLYRRRLDAFDPTPIAGTSIAFGPFFSPDGEWVAYSSLGVLRKVPINGGAPLPIASLPAGGLRGGSWGENGNVYFSLASGPVRRVSEDGGPPEDVTTLGEGERSHRWPHLLPGGRALIYTSWLDTGPNTATIYAESLDTHERHIVVRGASMGRYLDGHVLYVRPEGLMAVPFDPATLETTGPARLVVEDVLSNGTSGVGHFAVSANGTLIYEAGGGAETTLVWIDRRGGETPVRPEPGLYSQARLSPDGTRIALTMTADSDQVFVLDPARNTLARRTFEGSSSWPAWTPDSRRLTYSSVKADGQINVYWRPADGSGVEERLTTDAEHSQWVSGWSSDGRLLMIEEIGGGLSYLTMDGTPTRHDLLETAWNKDTPRLSPDGRWLAYASSESGSLEVTVQPFPSLDGKYLISTGGGTSPRWSRDGRQLFYWAAPGRIIAVTVTTEPVFSASTPTVLFEGPYLSDYDVTPDGQRFLMIKTPASGLETGHFRVVTNLSAELRRGQ